MEKTLWTPRLYGTCDFGVNLDRDFALDMIQAKVPAEKQAKMNRLGNMDLKKLGSDWLNPYQFHKDTCFVTHLYLGEGVWLATRQAIDDLLSGRKSSEPIDYESHNVDTPKQAYTLMALFDRWIEYADVFKAS
jgi:hypothetical protein